MKTHKPWMKICYYLLFIASGATFAIGVIMKILGPEATIMGCGPQAAWKFSMACIAMAIFLGVVDIRDHLIPKKE